MSTNNFSFRTVALRGITYPIKVAHHNLAAQERIDDLAVRIDTLKVSLAVDYQSAASLTPGSLDGTWNYGTVYERLCLSDMPTITGPLEGILDSALNLIEVSAKDQGVSLLNASVSADRMGLAVGFPRLRTQKIYTVLPEPSGCVRSTGVCTFPLVIRVDHSWCTGDQRVEHTDIRVESVLVSFYAESRAHALSDSDLSGLYNYAGLIHQVKNLQDLKISGPVEQLCDIVQDLLEQDALSLGVELLKTVVKVERTGYARCTPILSSTRYFQ